MVRRSCNNCFDLIDSGLSWRRWSWYSVRWLKYVRRYVPTTSCRVLMYRSVGVCSSERVSYLPSHGYPRLANLKESRYFIGVVVIKFVKVNQIMLTTSFHTQTQTQNFNSQFIHWNIKDYFETSSSWIYILRLFFATKQKLSIKKETRTNKNGVHVGSERHSKKWHHEDH